MLNNKHILFIKKNNLDMFPNSSIFFRIYFTAAPTNIVLEKDLGSKNVKNI